MFKTVIVDDDIKQIRTLKKMLQEHCPLIELIGEAKSIQSAYRLIEKEQPALVFIDIILSRGNTFDMLDKLKEHNFEVIFTTLNEKHSYKAIKYNALDYLIKPVSIIQLKGAIDKAIKKITEKKVNEQLSLMIANIKSVQSNLQKIAVPTLEGFVFVQIDEIIRCEAKGTYTYIYTTKKERIIASKNIKEYEAFLPQKNFFRIHNSHLININRIVKYNKGRGGTITMEDGTQIEVATRRKNEFLELFM